MVFRTVPEPNSWWGALPPKRRLLALRQVLPLKFRQNCSILVLSFWQIRDNFYNFSLPDVAEDAPCFSGAGVVSTEAEVIDKRRRKHAVNTRRCVYLSGQEPAPVEFGSHKWSRKLLEHAFDDSKDEFK